MQQRAIVVGIFQLLTLNITFSCLSKVPRPSRSNISENYLAPVFANLKCAVISLQPLQNFNYKILYCNVEYQPLWGRLYEAATSPHQPIFTLPLATTLWKYLNILEDLLLFSAFPLLETPMSCFQVPTCGFPGLRSQCSVASEQLCDGTPLSSLLRSAPFRGEENGSLRTYRSLI